MRGTLKTFQNRLLAWYRRHRRDLPWRTPLGERDRLPDGYHVLVSEAMLQQTQVATVIPYFERFIERMPTVQALAEADEQVVLRLWQGLGYYSRARNLQCAARAIVERFGGTVPSAVDDLLTLPGVGRYTAGAIASIAHDQPAAIVDGNVIRVLCRIDRIEADPRADKAAMGKIWARAEAILPRKSCANFNSALMELGASVCLPRQPRCLTCPVRLHCEAAEAGVQDRIPPPRTARPTPLHQRLAFCVARDGAYLIERRPPRGRWGGLWQFITVEAPADPAAIPSPAEASALVGLRVHRLERLGQITHALTHRRYSFEAFAAEIGHSARTAAPPGGRAWVSLVDLDGYPLSRPQLKIAQLLRDHLARRSG